MAKKNKLNELYIIRMYEAPVKMVWDAWVDPKQVAKWWGPRGFTLTTKSKDVKPGGKWIYTMHGPDGVDYPNITVFHEVEKYSRLVYDHGANENQPAMFRVTVDFTEVSGGTKMEMTMAMKDTETATQTKKFIKQAGGDSTWDRLAEFLSEDVAKKDIFVINRAFEAPLKQVFAMFSDPNHISKWTPPTGFEMQYKKADVRVGGESFYRMNSIAGGAHGDVEMYGKAKYLEINSPNRIVYTQVFCDKDGNISRHPFAPTWPEAMLTTVKLAWEEDTERTRVTIQWQPYGAATEAEVATFKNGRNSMTQGWTGSFDKLEEYLKEN